FPCRVAFRVSAKVDSRTILDQNGAETPLGNGDMLFLPPGKSEPLRVQGAFISTEETERLMDWYKAHAARAVAPAGASIDEQVAALEQAEKAGDEGRGTGDEGTPGERDSLFRQAAEVCIQNQLGSTSLLQRCRGAAKRAGTPRLCVAVTRARSTSAVHIAAQSKPVERR